ncbi:metallophosphoesterase family protein [Bacillus fonticola]|uniref:metallophosphoesterase family protein n=1 Tax=Bacillus fonticola TaxID=2728853 RepID=UPI0014746593|nr:metallophosphoesterase family protein [Bacillus fonticola]
MKIGIISDTHMPKRAKQLPERLVAGIHDVDVIIHAGDWTNLDVYHQLCEIAPVEGVFGNVDSPELKAKFTDKLVLDLKGFKIGVTHGHLGKKKTTPARALEAFETEEVNLIIFGHSHIPYIEQKDHVVLFNPGSPTDKRFQPTYSYGVLTLNDRFSIKHYDYDDKS